MSGAQAGEEKVNLDGLQQNFAVVFVAGTHFLVRRTCQWLPRVVLPSKMAVRVRLTVSLTHLTQDRLLRSSPNISATSSTIRTPWSQVRTLKHAVRSSANAQIQTVLRSRRNSATMLDFSIAPRIFCNLQDAHSVIFLKK